MPPPDDHSISWEEWDDWLGERLDHKYQKSMLNLFNVDIWSNFDFLEQCKNDTSNANDKDGVKKMQKMHFNKFFFYSYRKYFSILFVAIFFALLLQFVFMMITKKARFVPETWAILFAFIIVGLMIVIWINSPRNWLIRHYHNLNVGALSLIFLLYRFSGSVYITVDFLYLGAVGSSVLLVTGMHGVVYVALGCVSQIIFYAVYGIGSVDILFVIFLCIFALASPWRCYLLHRQIWTDYKKNWEANRFNIVADSVMRKLMPGPIIEQMYRGEDYHTSTVRHAAVLFAIIDGVDDLVAKCGDSMEKLEQLIAVMHTIISRFDKLTNDVHGLYKVSSNISASYLAIAGLPEPVVGEAVEDQAISLALDITDEFEKLKRKMPHYIQQSIGLRIGVNAGDIAGHVIGLTKPIYSTFGDCVNTASRLASTGFPGRIQVTSAFLSAMKGKIVKVVVCDRGMVKMKGKGCIKTCFLSRYRSLQRSRSMYVDSAPSLNDNASRFNLNANTDDNSSVSNSNTTRKTMKRVSSHDDAERRVIRFDTRHAHQDEESVAVGIDDDPDDAPRRPKRMFVHSKSMFLGPQAPKSPKSPKLHGSEDDGDDDGANDNDFGGDDLITIYQDGKRRSVVPLMASRSSVASPPMFSNWIGSKVSAPNSSSTQSLTPPTSVTPFNVDLNLTDTSMMMLESSDQSENDKRDSILGVGSGLVPDVIGDEDVPVQSSPSFAQVEEGLVMAKENKKEKKKNKVKVKAKVKFGEPVQVNSDYLANFVLDPHEYLSNDPVQSNIVKSQSKWTLTFRGHQGYELLWKRIFSCGHVVLFRKMLIATSIGLLFMMIHDITWELSGYHTNMNNEASGRADWARRDPPGTHIRKIVMMRCAPVMLALILWFILKLPKVPKLFWKRPWIFNMIRITFTLFLFLCIAAMAIIPGKLSHTRLELLGAYAIVISLSALPFVTSLCTAAASVGGTALVLFLGRMPQEPGIFDDAPRLIWWQNHFITFILDAVVVLGLVSGVYSYNYEYSHRRMVLMSTHVYRTKKMVKSILKNLIPERIEATFLEKSVHEMISSSPFHKTAPLKSQNPDSHSPAPSASIMSSSRVRRWRVLMSQAFRQSRTKLVPIPVPTEEPDSDSEVHDSMISMPAVLEYHDDVTIVVVDIVGFTRRCKQLSPVQVTDLLGEYFRSIDKALVPGIFMVDVIGDAFVCMSGAPEADGDGPRKIIEFCFRVLKIGSRTFWPQSEDPIEVRIGVSRGPCHCAVMGVHRVRYQPFGRNVQEALRLEALGVPGQIHASKSVVEKLNFSEYICVPSDVPGPAWSGGASPIFGRSVSHTAHSHSHSPLSHASSHPNWFVLGIRVASSTKFNRRRRSSLSMTGNSGDLDDGQTHRTQHHSTLVPLSASATYAHPLHSIRSPSHSGSVLSSRRDSLPINPVWSTVMRPKQDSEGDGLPVRRRMSTSDAVDELDV